MAHSDSSAEDGRSTVSMTPDITEEQDHLQDDTSILEANSEHRASDEEEDEGVQDMHRLSLLSTDTAEPAMFEFVQKYGRTYHQYHYCKGKYSLPNDEKEKERLDFQHKIWIITLNSQLYLAPIDDRLRTRGGGVVLDMCTGTGIWAMDFADTHPSAVVTGIDLSPIQPVMVPPNLRFLVDDAEDTWCEEEYDYIHGRMLSPCFTRTDDVIKKAVRALKPGGFLELQDGILWFECDDGSLGPAMKEWQKMLYEATSKSEKDLRCPTKYVQYMRNTGLVNVTEEKFKWPTNMWPIDRHEKKLGSYSSRNFPDWVESASLAVMIEYLGKTEEEVKEILRSVQREIANKDIHAYISVNVVYGQKLV